MRNVPLDIVVAGAGSWGTTLAVLLSENEHRVKLWARREQQREEMREARTNARYLPGVAIPGAIEIVADLDNATADTDMFVLAVPTHTVREVVDGIRIADRALVVNTAKGLEEETLARMSRVIADAGGLDAGHVLALLGPSHAEEVSRQIPTSIVVAGLDVEACRQVQAAFARPYFRVYTNADVVGVEIATALKNAIAIAAGVIDGLEYGDNTKAALVTRGLAEIARLGSAMGAHPSTFSGLAGVGDLVVTCLSRHSRNRGLGEAIGRGKTLDEALSEMIMIAEGVRTTRAAVALGKQLDVELPIIEMVHRVLFEDSDAREAVKELMTRPLRGEMADGPERRA